LFSTEKQFVFNEKTSCFWRENKMKTFSKKRALSLFCILFLVLLHSNPEGTQTFQGVPAKKE